MKKKIVLITGASAGIGYATALMLVLRGHIVYAAARRVEKMQAIVDGGGTALFMDVTNEASMLAGVDQIVKAHGHIDVLINNAGYGSLGAVEEVDLDEARSQFEVNLFGVARLCQLVLPHMRSQGKGRIVNVSSIGARVYQPLSGWYHSTKFALEGLSDCMRLELKQFGIDVVMVRPGFIRTEWDKVAHENLAKFSDNGSYLTMANQLSNAHINFLFKYFASDAPVVAKTITRIVETRKPATRYVTGRGARLFLFGRKLLNDRSLDWIFSKMLLFLGRNQVA